MAIHAGLGGRDHRMLRIIHTGMAVAAVDPHRTGMVCVAEWDGLLARFTLARSVRRVADQFEQSTAAKTDYNQRKDQTGSG